MKHVSLSPAVFHLHERVNAVATAYAVNPVIPRGPKLAPILERVRAKTCAALGCAATHVPVFLTCSGSGAIAAALGSCVGDRGILIVSNGTYGERQASYGEQIGLRTIRYALPYGERPDLREIERLALQHDVEAIGIVHGATSTCSLNPIAEVGALAKRLRKAFIVDGVASLFVEHIDLDALGVDVMIGSTNKGLHSNPDLAFVLVREPLLEELRRKRGRVPYLDLGQTWNAQREGSHPYTINIRALLEVDAALDVLADEGGVAARIATYQARNRLLRDGFQRLGIERFERPGMPLQNIGTALFLPDKVRFEALADALAAWNDGSDECYQIYSAPSVLSDKVFRVFNMGVYSLETYARFINALGAVLARLR
jgi:2-aminoethylphosphonate-pyruvate transaminase